MPKMKISRFIKIEAPAEQVFSVIKNYKEWKPWSPWLIAEPDCKLTYAEDGSSYEWEGNRIGSGRMEMREENPNTSISMDLNFIKPWKSYADIRFELKETDGVTNVDWLMNSSLPFFLFFMKKSMEAYVGADYERGLTMLKAYVETGEVPFNLEFRGTSDFEAIKYVGITTETDTDTIDEHMERDFKKLHEVVAKNFDNISEHFFSIYHKWDFVKRKTRYTVAMPVKDVPASLPSDIITGTIPFTKVCTLRLTGAYDYIGNAWATMMMMARNKEFKQRKGIHPFEIYRNDPAKTAPKDLITDVVFPIK